MFRQIRTAVAAVAAEGTRMQVLRALAHCGIELAAMTGDASSAMEAVKKHRPDLLIADELLPQMEGARLARLVLESRSLPVRPAAILLTFPEFPSPHRSVSEEMGAVFIEKPVDPDIFRHSVLHLESTPPHFPASERALIRQLMDDLGFPDHIGTRCLEASALLCSADARHRRNLLSGLYPAAGKICGISASQAERAMRHAIDLAWQSNKFENQYRIFADTVDAGRGQPTCGEMISRLADILRLEG